MTLPYRSLAHDFRDRLGRPARKIPLDFGFSCPNRDGTLGLGGCLFCPPHGAGNGLGDLAPAEQWERLTGRLRAAASPPLLFAYAQAFSNTHGPLERLDALLHEIAALPNVFGLCLGTRPDCLDDAKLDRIASSPFREIRLELGLQSADDAVLAGVNRGHTAAQFADAARAAARRGLRVVAHLMAGLPGAAQDDLVKTATFLNELPIAAVKFHNTFVAHGAGLDRRHQEGDYTPQTLEDYAVTVAAAIRRLRPDIVVERLAADPKQGECIAPDWANDKNRIRAAILAALGTAHQGDRFTESA